MSDQAAIDLLYKLCTEWPSLSREDLHNMLTPDCLYINMPMPEGRCIGTDQTYDLFAAFVGGWDVDMQVLQVQGDAATVLTERVETCKGKAVPDKGVQLRVMGAFEIRDGKNAHWRDYFDSKESAALLS